VVRGKAATGDGGRVGAASTPKRSGGLAVDLVLVDWLICTDCGIAPRDAMLLIVRSWKVAGGGYLRLRQLVQL
jgi:hypothetical protein